MNPASLLAPPISRQLGDLPAQPTSPVNEAHERGTERMKKACLLRKQAGLKSSFDRVSGFEDRPRKTYVAPSGLDYGPEYQYVV